MAFISTYSAASIRAWLGETSQNWIYYDDLILSPPIANLKFGTSCDINGDGSYIVVGCAAGGPATRGYVKVFSGASYNTITDLSPAGNVPLGYGRYVAINGSGNTVIASKSGNLVIFTRSGNSWNQIYDTFTGSSVTGLAINPIGDYCAVDNSTNRKIYTISGNTVTQQQVISGFTIAGAMQFDENANRFLTGDYGANSALGAAYMYTRSGNTWSLEATLTPNSNVTGTRFGYSCAMDTTATKILIGAPSYDLVPGLGASGAFYAYSRSGNSYTLNQRVAKAIQNEELADNISMNYNGTEALISAEGYNNGNGIVYSYSSVGNQWIEISNIQSPNISNTEAFAAGNVILAGNVNIGIVGAPGWDSVSPNALQAGKVYVYAKV